MNSNTHCPVFTQGQITWLRERFAKPQYRQSSDLAECNWRAGRASVVQEIELLMLNDARPAPSAKNKFNL